MLNKEELLEFLKENLSIEVEQTTHYGGVKVTLLLEGDIISTDYEYII